MRPARKGEAVTSHSIEAERAVLGSVMLRNDVMPQVAAQLTAADFWDGKHRKVYEACVELYPDAFDYVSVYEELRQRVPLDYLSKMCDGIVTTAAIDHHVKIVADRARIRRIHAAGAAVVDGAEGAVADVDAYAAASCEGIARAAERTEADAGPRPVGDGLPQLVDGILEGRQPTGCVPTGLASLDAVVGGLWARVVTVLAGRPSMGKTVFALNIAANVALGGKRVVIFSMEEPHDSLRMRMLARYADIDLTAITHAQIPNGRQSDIMRAMTTIDGMNLHVDEQILTAGQVAATAAVEKARHGLDLIIVDHLGYIKGQGKEYDIVSDNMRAMVAMAKDLNVPVLLLVQLNRAITQRGGQGTVPTPQMSDLRGSGHIEEDARGIWFAHRPEYYDAEAPEHAGVFEVRVAKQANGRTGFVRLQCDLSRMYIHDAGSGGY